MCIMCVAVHAHDDFSFILAHNRDEFFSREATPAHTSADGILSAIDVLSGGTWMGLNVETGGIAALTNVRCPVQPSSRSRGELVTRVLRGVGVHDVSDLPAFIAADNPEPIRLGASMQAPV